MHACIVRTTIDTISATAYTDGELQLQFELVSEKD